MKLDFSALAQPAENARGQVGTRGIPASTRVCAPPFVQPSAGTTGDKPMAAVLVADLGVALPASCPPLSPACPHVTSSENPNAGAVSPTSPLAPIKTAQGEAAAPSDHDPDRYCWPHSPAMNTAEIDTFYSRLATFTDQGLDMAAVEALADKLVVRDREHDDRRLCIECVHLRGTGFRVCSNRATSGIAQLSNALVRQLQRCNGFTGYGLG